MVRPISAEISSFGKSSVIHLSPPAEAFYCTSPYEKQGRNVTQSQKLFRSGFSGKTVPEGTGRVVINQEIQATAASVESYTANSPINLVSSKTCFGNPCKESVQKSGVGIITC